MSYTEHPAVERNAFGEVAFEVIRARHRAAVTGRCGCGRKHIESDVHRVGSRTWVSCLRCLGTIRQLS